jgi:hypothetical protein
VTNRAITVSVAVSVAVAQAIAQFAAWSVHPGNTATGFGWTLPWQVLSLPLFAFVPRSMAEAGFGLVSLANSLLWGAAGALLTSWLVSKRGASSSAA